MTHLRKFHTEHEKSGIKLVEQNLSCTDLKLLYKVLKVSSPFLAIKPDWLMKTAHMVSVY